MQSTTRSSPDQQRLAASEGSALSRAVKLLNEAQISIQRAGDDVAIRNAELTRRIQDLEETVGEMERLLHVTENQAAQLTNLYVATYQLHASLDPADVRAAIADIAVNLLGAERFAILVRDEAGELCAAPEGVLTSESPGAPYNGGDSLIDTCISEACSQFGPARGSEAIAVVPFVAQSEVIGVLVVRAFLRHKPGLSAEDRELLDLMAVHAASALLAARAFHVTQRKLTAYQGLLGFMRGSAR